MRVPTRFCLARLRQELSARWNHLEFRGRCSSGTQCHQGWSFLENNPSCGVWAETWKVSGGPEPARSLICHPGLGAGCAVLGQDAGSSRTARPLLAKVAKCSTAAHTCFQHVPRPRLTRPKGLLPTWPQAKTQLTADWECVLQLSTRAHASSFRMKVNSLTITGCYTLKCWFAYLVGLDFSSFLSV